MLLFDFLNSSSVLSDCCQPVFKTDLWQKKLIIFFNCNFFSIQFRHCRPDQKSAPQKICGSACTLVNQLVWSKNDPWWRPDFFWATPKFEKASKRPQNWKLKTIRNFNPVDGFKHLRGHLGVLFQAQSNRKVKSAVYCTNQLT